MGIGACGRKLSLVAYILFEDNKYGVKADKSYPEKGYAAMGITSIWVREEKSYPEIKYAVIGITNMGLRGTRVILKLEVLL